MGRPCRDVALVRPVGRRSRGSGGGGGSLRLFAVVGDGLRLLGGEVVGRKEAQKGSKKGRGGRLKHPSAKRSESRCFVW